PPPRDRNAVGYVEEPPHPRLRAPFGRPHQRALEIADRESNPRLPEIALARRDDPDEPADEPPRRPEVRRRRGLATRDRQQDALDDPVVRPEDQAATHRRLDGEPARRHVAVPLEQRRRDREGGGAAGGHGAPAQRHRARALTRTAAAPGRIK